MRSKVRSKPQHFLAANADEVRKASAIAFHAETDMAMAFTSRQTSVEWCNIVKTPVPTAVTDFRFACPDALSGDGLVVKNAKALGVLIRSWKLPGGEQSQGHITEEHAWVGQLLVAVPAVDNELSTKSEAMAGDERQVSLMSRFQTLPKENLEHATCARVRGLLLEMELVLKNCPTACAFKAQGVRATPYQK